MTFWRSQRSGRTQIIALVLSFLGVLLPNVSESGASGLNRTQTPTGWPQCPGTARSAMLGQAPSSQTRGVIVSRWFASLRSQFPTIDEPAAIRGVPTNEKVTVCAVASTGTASDGLGTESDIAIVAARVDQPTIELVSFDSQQFGIGLPAIWFDEIASTTPTVSATVVRYRRAQTSDTAVAIQLGGRVFESKHEVVSFVLEAPFVSGGEYRIDAVAADDCGLFRLTVVVRNGAIETAEPTTSRDGAAPACATAEPNSFRSLVAGRPMVALGPTGLTLTVGSEMTTLRPSGATVPSRWRAILTRTAGRIYRASRSVTFPPAFPADSPTTNPVRNVVVNECNPAATIAFGSTRFIVSSSADFVLGPTASCRASAARGLVSGSISGTYVRLGRRMILHCGDGSTVELLQR